MTLFELKIKTLETLNIHSDYDWMLYIFIIMTFTAMASLFVSLFLGQFAKRLKRTSTKWDEIFIDSIRKPTKMLVWIFGISESAKIIMARSELEMDISSHVANMRDVAVVVMIAWGLLRFIKRGKHYFITNKNRKGENYDLTTVHAMAKLLSISVIISTALIALQNLGISISGLLAFGGVGGLAVGFAAKDMLANFFGALIIYFDKPFKVGDWVRSPDQEIEGTVQEIGWRMTTIQTFDKRPLYVPNSVFTTISVENPSRMTHRRIYETIGIRYDDVGVMDLVVHDVKEMLIANKEIDESQTLIVNFNAFNTSSCDFFVYTFTHTTNWIEYHSVKHDVLLKIAEIINNHGAEIAYPTQVEYNVEVSSAPLEIQRATESAAVKAHSKKSATGRSAGE